MGTLSVNQNKLQKRLRRLAGEAVTDFNMIEEGDKVIRITSYNVCYTKLLRSSNHNI